MSSAEIVALGIELLKGIIGIISEAAKASAPPTSEELREKLLEAVKQSRPEWIAAEQAAAEEAARADAGDAYKG